ncbi:MAG TPA: hypothetical protein PKC59_05455, partial [Burkholderiaceae bacterium]|nr:hypothetical protein [Burkholderiaceae bacterium]
MTRTILHLLRLGGAATALLATLLPAGAQPASAASAPGAAPPAAAAEASGPLGIDAPRAGTLTALDARVIDALDAWRKRDRARLVASICLALHHDVPTLSKST